MKVYTFSYQKRNGWSVESFPSCDSPSTMVLVFGSSHYYDTSAPITELAEAYPNSHILGCSTSGEIYQVQIMDDSLSVAVVVFEKSKLASAWTAVHSSSDSHEVGIQLATRLRYANENLQGIFVLSEGTVVNGSELVKGMNSALPADVTVTGGLAGDGSRFERTWVLKSGKPSLKYVSAIAFYGDAIRIGHGSKGGWDIFGPERLVTRSERQVLYELDDMPALEVYKRYLGDRASELPASALLFPLALRENKQVDAQIVRTILAVDEENQSLTFAGDIPQGSLAQFMKANFDRLVEGASKAALMTRQNTPVAENLLSIAISCVGRRLVMGEYTEDELEAVLESLPAGTQQVGFYSYGEISPFVTTGQCDLHNQTMTLTTIVEE